MYVLPFIEFVKVLDPEQNSGFVDHYLNLPFDLSQVSVDSQITD